MMDNQVVDFRKKSRGAVTIANGRIQSTAHSAAEYSIPKPGAVICQELKIAR